MSSCELVPRIDYGLMLKRLASSDNRTGLAGEREAQMQSQIADLEAALRKAETGLDDANQHRKLLQQELSDVRLTLEVTDRTLRDKEVKLATIDAATDVRVKELQLRLEKECEKGYQKLLQHASQRTALVKQKCLNVLLIAALDKRRVRLDEAEAKLLVLKRERAEATQRQEEAKLKLARGGGQDGRKDFGCVVVPQMIAADTGAPVSSGGTSAISSEKYMQLNLELRDAYRNVQQLSAINGQLSQRLEDHQKTLDEASEKLSKAAANRVSLEEDVHTWVTRTQQLQHDVKGLHLELESNRAHGNQTAKELSDEQALRRRDNIRWQVTCDEVTTQLTQAKQLLRDAESRASSAVDDAVDLREMLREKELALAAAGDAQHRLESENEHLADEMHQLRKNAASIAMFAASQSSPSLIHPAQSAVEARGASPPTNRHGEASVRVVVDRSMPHEDPAAIDALRGEIQSLKDQLDAAHARAKAAKQEAINARGVGAVIRDGASSVKEELADAQKRIAELETLLTQRDERLRTAAQHEATTLSLCDQAAQELQRLCAVTNRSNPLLHPSDGQNGNSNQEQQQQPHVTATSQAPDSSASTIYSVIRACGDALVEASSQLSVFLGSRPTTAVMASQTPRSLLKSIVEAEAHTLAEQLASKRHRLDRGVELVDAAVQAEPTEPNLVDDATADPDIGQEKMSGKKASKKAKKPTKHNGRRDEDDTEVEEEDSTARTFVEQGTSCPLSLEMTAALFRVLHPPKLTDGAVQTEEEEDDASGGVAVRETACQTQSPDDADDDGPRIRDSAAQTDDLRLVTATTDRSAAVTPARFSRDVAVECGGGGEANDITAVRTLISRQSELAALRMMSRGSSNSSRHGRRGGEAAALPLSPSHHRAGGVEEGGGEGDLRAVPRRPVPRQLDGLMNEFAGAEVLPASRRRSSVADQGPAAASLSVHRLSAACQTELTGAVLAGVVSGDEAGKPPRSTTTPPPVEERSPPTDSGCFDPQNDAILYFRAGVDPASLVRSAGGGGGGDSSDPSSSVESLLAKVLELHDHVRERDDQISSLRDQLLAAQRRTLGDGGGPSISAATVPQRSIGTATIRSSSHVASQTVNYQPPQESTDDAFTMRRKSVTALVSRRDVGVQYQQQPQHHPNRHELPAEAGGRRGSRAAAPLPPVDPVHQAKVATAECGAQCSPAAAAASSGGEDSRTMMAPRPPPASDPPAAPTQLPLPPPATRSPSTSDVRSVAVQTLAKTLTTVATGTEVKSVATVGTIARPSATPVASVGVQAVPAAVVPVRSASVLPSVGVQCSFIADAAAPPPEPPVATQRLIHGADAVLQVVKPFLAALRRHEDALVAAAVVRPDRDGTDPSLRSHQLPPHRMSTAAVGVAMKAVAALPTVWMTPKHVVEGCAVIARVLQQLCEAVRGTWDGALEACIAANQLAEGRHGPADGVSPFLGTNRTPSPKWAQPVKGGASVDAAVVRPSPAYVRLADPQQDAIADRFTQLAVRIKTLTRSAVGTAPPGIFTAIAKPTHHSRLALGSPATRERTTRDGSPPLRGSNVATIGNIGAISGGVVAASSPSPRARRDANELLTALATQSLSGAPRYHQQQHAIGGTGSLVAVTTTDQRGEAAGGGGAALANVVTTTTSPHSSKLSMIHQSRARGVFARQQQVEQAAWLASSPSRLHGVLPSLSEQPFASQRQQHHSNTASPKAALEFVKLSRPAAASVRAGLAPSSR